MSRETAATMHHDRHGAKQPDRFDPARAAMLDDVARFEYVPPERLLAELALAPGATVVDFGTGTGLYAIAIAQRRPDVRVVAIDEQPAMLAHVRAAIERAAVDNVTAVDGSAIPSLRGTVQGVLALNVLHELGDRALGDVRALLAPDGVAAFVDWNAAVERPVGPPHDHVYTPGDAAARLASAGFAVEFRPAFAYHYALAGRRTAQR